MKAILKTWTLRTLRGLARRRIKQIRPRIIGITGSVGKTGAKEAIAAVLEQKFRVKKTEGNMNTEFGVALSLLDQKAPYSSLWAWICVLTKALKNSVKRVASYDMLVLEMGVDKPGDMDELLKVVRPEVMVFLNVQAVHVGEGQFPNREAIFHEKSKSCYAVNPDGWAVLNADDSFTKQLIDKLPCHVLSIGQDEKADLRASNIKSDEKGLHFSLHYEDNEHAVHLPHVLGACHVYLALAAIATGFLQGLSWSEIEAGLRNFKLPPGRMNRIEGKNGSVLIDSSYNASPESVEAGLRLLQEFSGRRIAALGTMNELGELTESAHLRIGKLVGETADLLIAVGAEAKTLAEGAQLSGLSSSMIHVFQNSKEAGTFLSELLEPGDVVLIKGSQNKVRMEHVTKACMKHPELAKSLLVRQDPHWLTVL